MTMQLIDNPIIEKASHGAEGVVMTVDTWAQAGPPGLPTFPLDIHFEADPSGRLKPNSLVKWTSNERLNAQILALGMANPLLIITIRHVVPLLLGHDADLEERDTSHTVTPFGDGWTSLRVPVAGPLTVIVTIADGYNKPARILIGRWKSFPYQSSGGNLHDETGTPIRFGDVPFIDTGICLRLHVEREDLAAAPPRWIAWLLNRYYTKPGTNSCRIGWRVLGLLGLIPLSLVFWWPIRLAITAFMLLAGLRNINPAFALPFGVREGPVEPYTGKKSLWTHQSSGKPRRLGFFIVNPFTLVVAPLPVYILVAWQRTMSEKHHHTDHLTWTLKQTYLYVDGALVATVIGLSLVMVSAALLLRLLLAIGALKQPVTRTDKEQLAEELQVVRGTLNRITPTTGRRQVRRRRWLRRWFAWLKTRHCELVEE